MLLTVIKMRTGGSPNTLPQTTPNKMAMRMRGRSPNLNDFISLNTLKDDCVGKFTILFLNLFRLLSIYCSEPIVTDNA